jgi:hypothetical protein
MWQENISMVVIKPNSIKEIKNNSANLSSLNALLPHLRSSFPN